MEFLVLGSLELRESGIPIRVRGMRQQRLLALLLLNANRVVPMDALVDELWEDPPPSARPQVHNAIRDLRRILSASDGTSLVTVDVGYRLVVPEDAVDAHRFVSRVRAAKVAERENRYTEAVRLLQSAVDLWRGEAFAGIQCPAVSGAAVKLAEQRLTAVEDLVALRLKLGETGSLVGELHALIAEYPLREALRGSLMIALCRSGRQADALAVYDEGRRFLVDELGLEPSPRLRALHAEILADSPDLHGSAGPALAAAAGAEPSDDRGTGPSAPPGNGRHYLPHDLTDFTGRTAELATLTAVAAQEPGGSPVMVAIDGMGGVGKTTLAVRLAHRVTELYPDGQYFINLHGFSATRSPVPTEQALAVLLQASGLTAQEIPPSLEERSALWRSRLAGRRCLVVLDDAADSAHVTPLLPGTGGTLVLVTSRRKLTALDGALPLCLDVLPPADAVTLFRRIVGEPRARREPAQVARAVELCGRLPLALRIAATRLRDRPAWAVADLVERLAQPAQRARCLQTADRDLMAVLRVSYDHLSAPERRFSRLISLQPAASYDIAHAALVTGLPAGDVEHHFDALIENNLIREDTPARFSFHSLIRDCTRELLVEEAGAAA
ncbi:AfsR/SARP family transcriptional regulator [Streptomyces sp. SLBN-115]|uniref:AfsR/SARP family transcriptional regulator n=1 Tax=Streptomyces sp. SLBN-115 TaxID=2768453 RepID=UPI00114F6B36|nr:AfsR/SARP family transcriptional regulator [Streptomyces sp. SLBN-115]TQJ55469.1 DNA-binding SARP family transcriptional activator [Streptomyces sp. SLBN-115]